MLFLLYDKRIEICHPELVSACLPVGRDLKNYKLDAEINSA